ncbi:acyltransferase [Lolliginicoccus suaedae]|uniref:acyltransferase n=1 Tax=Lolliginicoccus suaedae TaxID=2605429 RepID=UPI0011EBDEB8|nr:acyltransferase [Lolliginicoccus suaedae]
MLTPLHALLSLLLRLPRAARRRLSDFRWSRTLKEFGPGAQIGPSSIIYNADQVSLGANAVIGDFVHIWGGGGVSIGEDTMIGATTVITSQSHDARATRKGLLYRETHSKAPVVIGRNVFLGSNVTVLPGIRVGDNAIIGAGAVLTKDVPDNAIVMGVPARIVGSILDDPAEKA